MELERELRALAPAVEWPPTPALRPELAPRGRDLRRPLAAALALAAVALAAALAVPASRGAILRFFHLRGATVVRVDRLPPARERPLAATLGPAVSPVVGRTILGRPVLLPEVDSPPPLHALHDVVSLLFRDRGGLVLLSEAHTGSPLFLKKMVAGATRVESLRVGGDPGLWLSGASHVVIFPETPPRLAGNVLLWQHGALTLRLEGRGLTRERALELARSLR
jgi:hypothetical protein